MSYEKRFDGRAFDELRPIDIKIGVIKNAKGSAMFKIGDTIAIAGVMGPKEVHPKHLRNPEKGILQVHYDMMSFSVSDRARPGPDRRDIELSKVIKNALEPALILNDLPETGVYLYVYILQANAGTRCAAVCASSLALAHAGIPMKDLVPAVAAGKVADKIVLDLSKEEEDHPEGATDMAIAMVPRGEKITLLTMDGNISDKELRQALEYAKKGCMQIYKLQKEALRKFLKGEEK